MEPLTNQRILIISPEAWGKSMLSKHHYALALAERGNHVYFLQPPYAREMDARGYEVPGISVIADTYSFKGIRFLPRILRKIIYKRRIDQLERACGGGFDVVWSFDNSRFFDLSFFEGTYRIHHMMDFHTDYQTEIASRDADLCLGVTQGIVNKMKVHNANTFFVHHGWSAAPASEMIFPEVKEKVKALWTGNLIMPFVNWPWVHATIRAHREVHFFLAGGYQKGNLNPQDNERLRQEVERAGQEPNVTLLGEITPGDIASLTQKADLLFFAYRSNEFPDILANSHKIMAYLASGNPVVCHRVGEYLATENLLYMAETEEEFVRLMSKVVQHLDEFQKEEWRTKRIQFAHDNAYSKHVERIAQWIKQA